MEILAPAGSRESLLAAVRCGANAVYLGGKSFNARRNATNFDGAELCEAVRYCHARGVKVYLALNTLVGDRELGELESAGKTACEAGIDAIIAQDLAVAALVRERAPSIPLHASTQMSVYSLNGALELERLGFSRVVLARELSAAEIKSIAKDSALELECFVHGALCMCVSGQCYFSAMLGGRSGNRGLCAQPCRLPMACGQGGHSLSLKDLSLVEKIPGLADAGVISLKIEGRMKRPEYVAAAVSACKAVLDGKTPDTRTLSAVFSRGGFTSGYFDGKIGRDMFGVRGHEDVTAASHTLLSELSALYRDETPLVPVDFSLSLKSGRAAELTASDSEGRAVTVSGDIPQEARTAPTTYEKAAASLSKTGGTPFFARKIYADIAEGVILPASALNLLRRGALDALMEARGVVMPHKFAEKGETLRFALRDNKSGEPKLRVRIASPEQLTDTLTDEAELIIVAAKAFTKIDGGLLEKYADKIAVEIPRIMFDSEDKAVEILNFAKERGVLKALAGGLGGIRLAREFGFAVCGDYSLNIANTPAIAEYENLGLCDATLSFELTAKQIARLGGQIPRGILAYGHLPLMVTRNCPAGNCKSCKSPVITDRLGNKFPVTCGFGVSEVLNHVPLFLADRLGEFSGLDFITLYFTSETPERCAEILRMYQTRENAGFEMTRGLYFRGVT